jgi:hypothetical protein
MVGDLSPDIKAVTSQCSDILMDHTFLQENNEWGTSKSFTSNKANSSSPEWFETALFHNGYSVCRSPLKLKSSMMSASIKKTLESYKELPVIYHYCQQMCTPLSFFTETRAIDPKNVGMPLLTAAAIPHFLLGKRPVR